MEKMSSTNTSPGPRERFLLSPVQGESALSLDWQDAGKSRRRSTIHSYTIAVYHTLPKNQKSMKEIRAMTTSKAAKNLVSVSVAFMLIHTGFVSLQSLQSSLHPHGGLGLVSLSVIYGTTVLSCLLAPWLINRLTIKWTIVLAFSLFTAYFAANFYPSPYLIIPLSVVLGAFAGPMWSAQATYVTTLALTYSQHKKIAFESDDVINQFMGIFFGFYRSSQIWGNLISTLILNRNETDSVPVNSSNIGISLNDMKSRESSIIFHNDNTNVKTSSQTVSTLQSSLLMSTKLSSLSQSTISFRQSFEVSEISVGTSSPSSDNVCGTSTCNYHHLASSAFPADVSYNDLADPATALAILGGTRYMLLTSYVACGIMAVVVLLALLDHIHVGKTEADPEFSQSSFELCLATAKMLKDTKCLLLTPLVLFVGLEQGFMFGDFTKAYVSCAMGLHNIGPILICFGTVSAVSSITIGCFSKHIKRFAFITAGATFNVGLLIVLWLWKPQKQDVPNFYVVSACLGLCDAIWQTQTYTLFGVLFSHKQEAAFASFRMFHACGCAMAFGYSYFLCLETKVFILAGCLAVALALYSVIEMKMQLQSQHIGDIVAL